MKSASILNKIAFGTFIFLFSCLYTAKAQNLLISGSNSHSVVICANGNVFAWGKNDVGQLGLDANNSPYSAASSTTPLRVYGLGEIFQIDAGSGSHTLALTCEGKVYAWGANTTGQLGNNTDAPGAMSAKPVLVKAGATGTGDLKGVHYVSGGNDESFAILENGRAVSWGQNDKGQLGDGTTINRPAPVYILNGQTGQPLEDVVQIEAGDENGYALTGDGRVWSWGEPTDSKALGRANVALNTRAYPVQIQGGADLTDIIAISAGDRHCLAISVTGEVYSWGGDWGKGQLGRGPGYQDVNYAAKVVGGASGETFLGESDPVVSIAAGQAHSIASTASGKVYTWGSNGFFNCGTNCTTPAGQLGTGTLLTQPDYFGTDNGPNASPMLAKIGSAAGPGFTNAVSVSDGDAWSFVLTSDNKIYAAGWNREGQLSVAGNANQTSFRDITLPSCGVVSPCPTLDLGPDLKFCKTFSHVLSAGLVYPQFEAILYKNDVKVTSTVVTGTTAKEVTFPITEYANEWKIEIVDKRGPTDRPCAPCPIARDSIKIEEYTPSFTVPQPQTFCNDFSAYVNGAGVYYWYKNPTGGTPLDTTFKTQKTDRIKETDLNVPTTAQGDTFIAYAEEIGAKYGVLLKKANPNPTNHSSVCADNGRIDNITNNPYYQYIVAYQDVIIDSISIYIYGNGNPGTLRNYRVAVYNGGINPNNGAEVPTNTVFASGPRISVAEPAQNTDKLVRIPVGVTLPGSPGGKGYWIGFSEATVLYKYENSACTGVKKDDITGAILTQDGYASNAGGDIKRNATNPEIGGPIFNIQFHTKQEYCYRLPVKVVRQCPCNKPTKVTITTTPNPLLKCTGNSLRLTGNFADAGKPILYNSMSYVWYKKGGTITYKDTAITPSVGTKAVGAYNDASLAISDSGTYYLRVQDGKNPAMSSCYTEDSIKVRIQVLKKPIISDTTLHICEGASRQYTVPNTSGSTYDWTATNATPTTGTTDKFTITAGTADIKFTIQETSSIGCKSPIGTGTVKVDRKPIVPQISTNGGADITMCGTDQQLAIDPAFYTTGNKIKWTNNKSLTFVDATNAANTKADTLASTKAQGFDNSTGTAKFVVTVSNGVCPVAKDSINVIRSGELTAPNLKSDNNKLTVCIDGSLSFTGNARNTANSETSRWVWTPTANVSVDTVGANSNKATYTFSAIGSYVISYIIDNPTCPEKKESLTITVVARPTAVITDPSTLNSQVPPIKEKSINPTSYDLKNQTVPTGYTGAWSIKTGQGDIATKDATTGALTALGLYETNPSTGVGTTDVYWTVTENTGSCPAAKDSARIIRRNMTIPDLGPDTVKCTSALPFTRKTNVGDTIPGIETVKWSGQTNFVQGTDIVVPANTPPGTYTVSVAITNNATTPATVNTDDFTIIVQQPVKAVLDPLVPNPRTTCATSVQLPGGISPALATATGTWKISAASTATATIVTPSDSTSNLAGLTSPSTVDLWWVVQNGTCPKDSIAYQVIQAGKITTPEIIISGGIYANDTISNGSADTLCANIGYTLTSSAPDPARNETGLWTLINADGTSITVSGSKTTQAITPTAEGIAEISWTITPDPAVPGCTEETAKAKLYVYEAPVISSVVGPPTLPCEDDAVNKATAEVTYSSTLTNTKVQWSITPGGTGSATLVTGDKAIAEFANFTSTATRGTRDSIAVTVKVTNACAFDTEPKNIAFNLKPRELYKGDTIAGPTTICETWPAVGYWFDHKHPNTDNIQWYWTLGSNPEQLVYTAANDPVDTAVYANTLWGDISVVTNATVRASLGNVCGYGKKDTSIQVKVIPAVDFDFNVVSDKIQNSFCIPLDVVGVWAQQTTPDSLDYGNVAEYAFATTSGTVIQAQSPARGVHSMFTSDTTIVVTAFPQQWACLNTYDPLVKTIQLKGYDKPTDTLTYSETTICEDRGPVRISLTPVSRNVGDVTWYKTTVAGTTGVYQTNGTSISASGPEGSGSYYAEIQNALKKIDPTTQCPGATTQTVAVKIYDIPNPTFSTNPLLIFYNENDPGIPMPLAETGTKDTLISIRYNPGIWLSSQDSLRPIIKTTMDEITVEYTLELKTGNPAKGPNAVCTNTGTIKVINTLPLLIPNAFSPNGDGKNEVWVIDGLGQYPDTRVKVYNRWGSAMFTDNYGYKVPWDGTHNGAQLASGTYYYVIELKGSPSGKEEVRTGSLTIVK